LDPGRAAVIGVVQVDAEEFLRMAKTVPKSVGMRAESAGRCSNVSNVVQPRGHGRAIVSLTFGGAVAETDATTTCMSAIRTYPSGTPGNLRALWPRVVVGSKK
jgi:hypothetical protein